MFFDGYERAGSGRGYIWSRTLPLLKDYIFIGSGPDSFVFEFPQDDIVGKMNFMHNTYIIVDKPHNLYLQMAINSGIISLILFLIAAGYFVLVGFYKIFKGYLLDPLAVGIYLSIVGYLATSFFNDSVVSIAPIFWIFFGYGMSKISKAKKLA
jgi:O-antigen ligase